MKKTERHPKVGFQNLRFMLLWIVSLILVTLPSAAQLTESQLRNTIDIQKLHHPYLFFSDNDKKSIIDRIKNDKECAKIYETLLAQGHRYLYVPIQQPEPQHPKHTRYVLDDPADDYEGDIQEGALTMAFLYQITGDMAYAHKAIEFAMDIADWPDWVNPAHHYDIIESRVWPFNVPDDRVVFSFDITSSGKAITLATVYDWIYPALTKGERNKIRNGLMEKAITRVRGNYNYFWWSTAYKCNWSNICYTGLGVTAMTLLRDNPELLDVVAEVKNRMDTTFSYIGDDGGWQEGRGYYGYMMRESVFFMDALRRLSGGKFNMFKNKSIADHPLDFELYGLTANFEDGGGYPVGPTYMVDKLIAETGNHTAAYYRENYLPEGNGIFDIIWPRTEITPKEPENGSKLFKTINWAILRSNFQDSSAFTVACKAGYNDDPHHGHLDCGQFTVTWYNVPFIRDLGPMSYDEWYFSEDRYQYAYAMSEGHNVISVNGEQQIIAKKKDTPWLKGIGGEILSFKTTPQRDYVLMDPTHAYPDKELHKWRRNIVLEKPVTTLILDEVDSDPGSTIAARIHPGVGVESGRRREQNARFAPAPNGEFSVHGNFALLSDQHRHTLAAIPVVLDNTCSIVQGSDPVVPVTHDARVVEIPFIDFITKSKSKTSVIATIITPVKNQSDAEDVVKSASIRSVGNNVEVSIDAKDGHHQWMFEKGKDGYTLKD